MMNRIDQRFAALKARGRRALVPYVTAGDPGIPSTRSGFMHAAVDAGADLVELGMPFSDVMADGPVIQNACERALKHVDWFAWTTCSTWCANFDSGTLTHAGDSDGVYSIPSSASVVVDCPADEADELRGLLEGQGLHQIFLVAPTTTDRRLAHAARLAGGFVYYVSIKGVTGAATLDVASLAPMVERIRASVGLPVAVGFGIREPEQAAAVAATADAVVIGSALVDRLDRCQNAADRVTRDYLAPVRLAMDNSVPVSSKEAVASK
jgi:tryptophan synthase alpha chain